MIQPDQARILAALEATWPAARNIKAGPWTVREGLGGGQRVSAATANGAVTEDDIATAEEGMRALDQRPLFMIRPGEVHDAWLAARGYDTVDPVTLYIAETDTLTRPLSLTAAIPSWPPLAIQAELWAEGGIDASRLAVMNRVAGAKTSVLGRHGDTPGGTLFVAADGDVAMLHALEVTPDERRKGIGRILVTAAANWAESVGATWLTLAVTAENRSANALYQSVGMAPAGGYHYRRAPEAII